MLEADKQVYKEVKFNENILTSLVENNNKIFNRLCSHRLISESELKILSTVLRKQPTLESFTFYLTYKKG